MNRGRRRLGRPIVAYLNDRAEALARDSKSKSRAGNDGTYVALLRGVNVGGKNKLPMADLAAMFTDAGCAHVRTYIQSGNVVFSATSACAKTLTALVPRKIEEKFGFGSPVVLRTAKELRKVAAANPFLTCGVGENWLHVMFLADLPQKRDVAALDPNRSHGDSFEVHGREIYLHLPSGGARSKLTNAYFDSKLGTTSTVRNWRTVLRLVEMTQAV